jgi:hypothetical protein
MWGDEVITYDRNLLYEQVWADPVQTVAKSYGVSGVYLARICRQLSVPLPPRGYWAKVHAGKSPRRGRLPKLKKDEKETIAVWRRSLPKRADVDYGAKLELPADVVVADELSEPHRLMAHTARRLARVKPSKGTVSGRPLGLLDVTVGPDSLDRAMRICDALVKGIEAIGLRLEITGPSELKRDEWGRHLTEHLDRVTRACCNEEWITLALWEEVRRSEDPKPEVKPRRTSWGDVYTPWQPTTYTYTPTGTLALQMTNISGLGLRATWRDGKHQRLEDCVAPFIAHLGVAAQALKADRTEKERERQEAEAERKRREEELEQRRAAQERLDRLEGEAEAWREANLLRDYAKEALARLDQVESPGDAEQVRRFELTWLLSYADRMDPLTH